MSVVAFRAAAMARDRDALIDAIVDLHAMITLDPILGASPVRIFFVVNPAAKAKVRTCAGLADGDADSAYGLVTYDFPFAVQLLAATAPELVEERTRAVITRSARLQAGLLRDAADAVGIDARPAPRFDAPALKAAFFPDTQETVEHLFELRLRPF
jgi:hypothetical protein